jgi:hypothetical protein
MVTNNNHHIIQEDEEMSSSHQYSYHSSSPKNNDDTITKILSARSESASHNHQDDDDDDESTYYHSIMERRRHIKPTNRDDNKDDDDEEQSVATNLPQVPSSARPSVMTSSRRRNTNTRRRARARSSLSNNNNHRRPINPIILIVILGISANWVANRLLNGLNNERGETIIIDDSYYMSRQHTIEHNAAKHHSSSIANNYNHHAQVSQRSEGEQMIGKLSLNKLSELSERYESDGEKHQDDAEIQAKIERLQKGIAQMKQQLASSTNNNNKVDATINEPNLHQDVQQALASPITERFVLLRKRLMSLYNEPEPNNKEGRSNNTTTHPLYNMDSPQFKALNWLANIDKSQITDDDPHVIQRFVLSVLYFATGGPPVDHTTDFTLKRRGGPWRNPTNFMSPNHECEWKSSITKGEGRGGGIRRCDADKNVVELSIYNELAGTIPSELGRLSFLRTLYLGRNNLVGTIPTELGMIRPIASISLQYNQLTGESSNN